MAVGVLQYSDDEIRLVLTRYGITADAARRRLIPARPGEPAVTAPPFARTVKSTLSVAHTLTLAGRSRIGCAHLLLALIMMREPSLLAFFRDRAEVDEVVAALTSHLGEAG